MKVALVVVAELIYLNVATGASGVPVPAVAVA